MVFLAAARPARQAMTEINLVTSSIRTRTFSLANLLPFLVCRPTMKLSPAHSQGLHRPRSPLGRCFNLTTFLISHLSGNSLAEWAEGGYIESVAAGNQSDSGLDQQHRKESSFWCLIQLIIKNWSAVQRFFSNLPQLIFSFVSSPSRQLSTAAQ